MSSSPAKRSARSPERELARLLEERQAHLRARIVVFSGHVHNYERFIHGNVTYFVTGGGGAHPYVVPRKPGDPVQSTRVNYHYLQVKVEKGALTVTMRRLGLETATPVWTTEDMVRIDVPEARP